MLKIEDLSVSYAGVQALTQISIDISEGEHVAVLGANGAGKTTLMRSIIGQKSVDSGTVLLNGKDITDWTPWDRAALGISSIPEGGRVFPEATVVQNLRTGAYLEEESEANERITEVFNLFPRLNERKSQRAGTLSGGEQQMLAIGRAMMSDPDIILVDEISMGLMPKLVDRAFEVLATLNDRGTSLLQVEQNVHKTLAVADRAYILEKGQVVAEGVPAELMNSDAIESSYLGVSE